MSHSLNSIDNLFPSRLNFPWTKPWAVVNFQSANSGFLLNEILLFKKILLGKTENKPDLDRLFVITSLIFFDKSFSSCLPELNFNIAIGIGSRFPLVISILSSENTKKG